MKLGRLLIAVVALAGLSAGVYWANLREKADANKPPANAPPKILTLQQDKINRIEFKRRDGETTTVQKDDSGKWSITAPKPLGADQGVVGTVAVTLATLTSDRVVDPNVTDLAAYGLAPAADELTLTTKDGKTTKLLVGDETPTGNEVYAKLDGDPRLFTMAGSNKASLDKSIKDLRDKRLMTFDQDKVSRVELTSHPKAAAEDIEFGRVNQSEWQILKPKPMRADGFQVDNMVKRVSDATMDTNASDEDLKKAAAAFAAAPALAVVKVTSASGTQTLEVRKSKDDYFAKSSVVDGIYKVPADLGTGLNKSVDDFRNKKLFDFGYTEPTKIEIKDGGKTVNYERSDAKWSSGGKTMDNLSFQAFLDKLRDLVSTKFVDTGFTTPALELNIVSYDGKRTEKVQIAPGSGGNFIARREGDTALYEIDAKSIQDLRQAAGDVKEEPPPAKKK
jgi:hypothetical protein